MSGPSFHLKLKQTQQLNQAMRQSLRILHMSGIELDREVELGRGPVDFKASSGTSARLLIEVKKLHNGRFWNGLRYQLPSYLQSDNINTVLLDGEKITLIPACYFSGQGCVAGMAGPDYRRIDPKDDENKAVTDHSKMYYNWRRNRDGEPIQKTVASKHLNYARYGWVYFYPPDDDRDYVGREYFFAHGQPTELAGKDAMPVEGKAVYRGYALVSYGSSPTSFAPSRYDARFNVDFGAKTLSGNLKADKEDYMSSVEFKAKINGNTFSGDTAYFDKSSNYNVGVYTEGGFYGPQAQELSGVFSGRAAGIWDFPTFKGSFGASKQ